jgi:hypothetical protein
VLAVRELPMIGTSGTPRLAMTQAIWGIRPSTNRRIRLDGPSTFRAEATSRQFPSPMKA